jgi:hypothetical protein
VRDQVVVTFREQAQQRRVILEGNGPQFRVPQRDNRGRPSVVGVGLVATCVVEKPNPCRQCGWHVEHGLTSRDELLGSQRARAGCAFDCPTPRFEPRRECHQPSSLRTIRADADLAHEMLTSVEHRRGVRCLVWVDTNEEHAEPPRRTTRWERPGGQS